MIEVAGDLWTYPADARVITTNGYVNIKGEAVMGRGCAKEAAVRWPNLSVYLGGAIKRDGNRVRFVNAEYLSRLGSPADFDLVFYPVKHHWREQADLMLIVQSAEDLKVLADRFNWSEVVMPRPGSGNGRLQWSYVKPHIEGILDDDRFRVIHYG